MNMGSHRIIMAMHLGYWPEVVDHINGDGSDNRIANLRPATHAENQRNQKRHKSNTSGITGVSWSKVRQVFIAQIKVGETSIYLGGFPCILRAALARWKAEKENGFSSRARDSDF